MSLREWWKLGLRWMVVAAGLALATDPARADAWFRAVQGGDVAYLPIYYGTPRIERYDLAAQAWLAPLPIPERPDVVAVAPDALYVQSETQLRRFTHGGAVVWSVPNVAEYLVVDPGGWVFSLSHQGNRLRVFDAADGDLLDERDLGEGIGPTSVHAPAVAPGMRRVFLQLSVIGSIRIASIPYDAAGTLGPLQLSDPVSSSFRTWVFPGEELIADGQGEVFDAETLEWRNSFFRPVDDLVFDGATPIRFGYGGLSRYSTTFEPVGDLYIGDADAVLAHGGTVFAFTNTYGSPPDTVASVVTTPVDSIVFEPLPEPYPEFPASVSPPRALGIDVHGTISFPHGASPGYSLYRWSVPGDDFTEPVAFRHPVDSHADCPLLGGMLFAWGTGELRVLPYGGTQDVHWRNVRVKPQALACTDGHVVVVTTAGLATYAPDGTDVDSQEATGPYTYYDAYATWSAARERLYVWMDGFSNEDELSSYSIHDDGTIELVSEASAPQYAGPILAVDGPFLVSGTSLSGTYLFDSETLERGPSLGYWRALGAAWLGGELYALRSDMSTLEIVVWNAAGQQTRSARVRNAVALFGYDGALRVGFYENGVLSVRTIPFDDLDADGRAGAADAFPNDPDEWSDRDGDGVGDNADEFPDDASETRDRDGDGIGDNADPFPYDGSEWSDRDGDGVGDNGDEFPDDGSEWRDRDADGVGDNADWAPEDPEEWADSDGDGVGDNADEFPLDPSEWRDYDGDGIGDHSDPFPVGDPELGLVGLTGKERAVFSRIGAVSHDLPPSTLGLLPNGSFSLCNDQGGCVFGAHRPLDTRGRRFELTIDPDFIAEIEPSLERALESALRSAFSGNVTLDLRLRPEDVGGVLKLDRSGKHGVLKVKWVFDAFLGNVPRRYQYSRFALVWKFRSADVVRPSAAAP